MHPNSRKTHCPQGHPYDEDNTVWSNGHRYCATCKREKQRLNRHRYDAKDRARRAERVQRNREYTKRHPEKTRAHKIINWAVRSGKLVKPKSCERCGQAVTRLEASHDDYEKPLEVEWLCPPCHGAKDRRLGRIAAPIQGELVSVPHKETAE